MTTEKQMPGGWSTEKPVTDEVENMCIKVANQAGVHFDVFIPKTYRHQTVAGRNFLVKVKVAEDDKYLHAMIFQAPSEGGKLTVKGVQYPKSNKDPLVPF